MRKGGGLLKRRFRRVTSIGSSNHHEEECQYSLKAVPTMDASKQLPILRVYLPPYPVKILPSSSAEITVLVTPVECPPPQEFTRLGHNLFLRYAVTICIIVEKVTDHDTASRESDY